MNGCVSLIKTLLESLESDLIICIENQVAGYCIHFCNQRVYSSKSLLKLLNLNQHDALVGEINDLEIQDDIYKGTSRIKNSDGKFVEFQIQGRQTLNFTIYSLTPTITEDDIVGELFDKASILMGAIELNGDGWIKIKENTFSVSNFYLKMDQDKISQRIIHDACTKSQRRHGELVVVDFGMPFPNWRFYICYIGNNKISMSPRFAYFGFDNLTQREEMSGVLERFFNQIPVMMGMDEFEGGTRRTLFYNDVTKKFIRETSVKGGWKRYISLFEEKYARTLTEDGPVILELDYPMLSGETAFYTGVISCVSKGVNGVSRHAFVLIETTHQKRVEAELAKMRKELEDRIRFELQETQDRFQSLVSSAPSTIMTVDQQGTIVFANRNFIVKKHEGGSYEIPLEGRSISTVVLEGVTLLHKIKKAFETNDHITIEMKLAFPELIWVSFSVARVNDKLAIIVATDITEIKKLSEELGRAVSAKSRFLANMSHEIRTPLSGIIGMSRMLSETGLTIDQADCVSTIQQCGETLLSVINDVLDYTKLEATGEMEILNEPFSLQQVLEDSLYTVVPLAEKKGLELILDIEPSSPDWIFGDHLRLRQILVNLLNNSTKFTNSGHIILSVSADKAEKALDTLFINIQVKDTGCGIPVASQSKLFQMFCQVDNSTTRRFGGTGIGLALARKFAELMGGKIWVDSTGVEGEGSTFSVCIPASLATATTPPSSTLSPFSLALCSPRTALVVIGKNKHSTMALKKRLHQKGFPNVSVLSHIFDFQPSCYTYVDQILCFLDAAECEYWDLPQSTKPVIAYIFMGTKRPEIVRSPPTMSPVMSRSVSLSSLSPLSSMTSYTRACSLSPGISSSGEISPLHMINSTATKAECASLLSLRSSTDSCSSTDSGSSLLTFPYIFDFARKPLKDSAICRCINYIAVQLHNLSSFSGFYPNNVLPSAAKQQSDPYTVFPLKIMVVEDNEINQKVIRKMLGHIGYTSISVVNNGSEALDAIEQNGLPDFIFMDIQMPVLDGVECTRILRRKYNETWPYILALTADAFPEDRVRCLNVGMNGFLTKPLRLEQVQASLENCYALKVKITNESIQNLVFYSTSTDSQGSKHVI